MFRGEITGGADKSLARTTSRFSLFDGENMSFDASLVIYIYIYTYIYIYIYSTNIPPIIIINRIYRGADKSLARPGKKPATATEDSDVHISYL